jgi:hypothetical protein
MAKVKSAKQRITDFLRAKGLDAGEIQDAFAELDAADADLDALADAAVKNQQWNEWYNQVQPALNEIVSERDTLKAQITKLRSAGLTFEEAKAAAQDAQNQALANQGPQFDPSKFQSDITRATNDLMKNVARYGLKHFKDYQEELDFDAVEKVMGEKGVPFEVAYNLYTEPKKEERRQKEFEEKLRKGIQEGIQAEASKQGIRRTRKRTDDIEPAPLDKPAPSDHDLKEAFLRDLDTEAAN